MVTGSGNIAMQHARRRNSGVHRCVSRGVSQAPICTGDNCSDPHDGLHSIQLQRLSGARLLQLPFVMSGEAAVMTFSATVIRAMLSKIA